MVAELVEVPGEGLGLQTTVDVARGLGYFTKLLDCLGLYMLGVDGARRFWRRGSGGFLRGVFLRMEVEGGLLDLGCFDLVFCLWLLYDLENPLRAMTRRLLAVEGVTYPGEEPSMTLVNEASSEDPGGWPHMAFYPTEACLVKMLYRAGFPRVIAWRI